MVNSKVILVLEILIKKLDTLISSLSKKCKNCGSPIRKTDAAYCGNCGKKLI
ncbi:MAG: zinc-ribbon domain-containing protein [Bacilli bacterium]